MKATQETGRRHTSSLAMKVALIAVSCLVLFCTLRTDSNPVGLRFQAAMDGYRHKSGTLSGFFALTTDIESCFELQQSGQTFQTVRLSSIEGNKMLGMKGKFDLSNSGRVHVKVPSSGKQISFTRFKLKRQGDKDMLELIDTQGKTVSWKYVRVSRYDCHFNVNEATCHRSRDEEIDAAFVISDDDDNAFVGRYISKGMGSVSIVKTGANSYAVKLGSYWKVMLRRVDIYFTHRREDGVLLGNIKVKTNLGKELDYRIHWNPSLEEFGLIACDGRPLSFVYTKAGEDSALEDGKAEL